MQKYKQICYLFQNNKMGKNNISNEMHVARSNNNNIDIIVFASQQNANIKNSNKNRKILRL